MVILTHVVRVETIEGIKKFNFLRSAPCRHALEFVDLHTRQPREKMPAYKSVAIGPAFTYRLGRRTCTPLAGHPV